MTDALNLRKFMTLMEGLEVDDTSTEPYWLFTRENFSAVLFKGPFQGEDAAMAVAEGEGDVTGMIAGDVMDPASLAWLSRTTNPNDWEEIFFGSTEKDGIAFAAMEILGKNWYRLKWHFVPDRQNPDDLGYEDFMEFPEEVRDSEEWDPWDDNYLDWQGELELRTKKAFPDIFRPETNGMVLNQHEDTPDLEEPRSPHAPNPDEFEQPEDDAGVIGGNL